MSTTPNPDPNSVTVTIPSDLGMTMILTVGGEIAPNGQYVFPDDTKFWVMEEAVEYALAAMPTVIFDAM